MVPTVVLFSGLQNRSAIIVYFHCRNGPGRRPDRSIDSRTCVHVHTYDCRYVRGRMIRYIAYVRPGAVVGCVEMQVPARGVPFRRGSPCHAGGRG